MKFSRKQIVLVAMLFARCAGDIVDDANTASRCEGPSATLEKMRSACDQAVLNGTAARNGDGEYECVATNNAYYYANIRDNHCGSYYRNRGR